MFLILDIIFNLDRLLDSTVLVLDIILVSAVYLILDRIRGSRHYS